ncbi:phosphatase PAP2 family protein [Flavobacterium aurantiibacter]|uniref:Phosphatase PAP2 family protein n=1 Tax=Flavobacterium aurantiibacter TaxID=2023067 RepID=A0A255ZN34_9FLAO|nr:phosphatase PAP2 family protein [Flavobacterium aurantiibacter]OYQ42295.1 phosphatase PAP2 family protein [Flavobacterium aurantiibacter]
MLEYLSELDHTVFLFLNNLGSERWDGFWLLITKQLYWTPFFLFLFYLLVKNYGWKHLLVLILIIALMLVFTDQTTNLVKNTFMRLRPCNDPTLEGFMREVKSSKSFSFFSGHASNSMASAVFIFALLRKHYRYAFLLFLWPLIFAYSRIYLGLHFPGDILCGYLFGILSGTLALALHRSVCARYGSKFLKSAVI